MKEQWDRQWHPEPRHDDPASPSSGVDKVHNGHNDWSSAMSLVIFSFALVLIMATALFASVGFNPKNEGYGKPPGSMRALPYRERGLPGGFRSPGS